ncbi:MAG TPA: SDR family oxidoreductase [Opitutaceae bacterium]|nr:SDR family oxidoreductase [Opitutaceae bacterium]HND60512.1 SDR family oxidoreductase [Opitutaceae bacterium]
MNIVVTGSSSGIGRALAERLLAHGHQVWGVARTDQRSFAAKHPGFRASRCDVASWEQMRYFAEEVGRDWPHLDGVVTCAALHGPIGPALAADPVAWGAAVRANLDGTYHALRALAPLLQRAPRRAKAVCFSGGGATKARPNFSAYGAAKTAVVRLVETIAAEERARPFDINAVAPGAINTRLTAEIIAAGEQAGSAEVESARQQAAAGAAPLEKALDLVEWLLSPASDGISGRLLSAAWDPWATLASQRDALARSEHYQLRRVTPQ